MLKRVILVSAVVGAMAVPALAANSCGSPPIAPAIPAASDLTGKAVEAGRTIVIDAYHQVKAYQAALKPYRDCLKAQEDNDKAGIAAAQQSTDKDAKSKIDSLTQDAENVIATENKTVDTEQQVATDFNTLHMAQCQQDTDPKICPKK